MTPPVVARGRDVSSYDSAIDYRAYDFIIGKFSESDDFVSPGALDRARATRAAGKVFSAYHFARPGDGARQADHFLSVEMPRRGDMPGWLDYEVDGLGRAFYDAFCNRYKARTGHWPGLYVNLSTFTSSGMRAWLHPGQLLWIARYGATSPGTGCDIWQWQGGPDLNVAYTPLSKMVIGGAAPQNGGADMAMVTLSGGRVAVAVRGTDHRPYIRVLNADGSARTRWQQVPGLVISSGVGACTRTGDDLWLVALDDDRSVLLVTLSDAEKTARTVQDLGGIGAGGAPGITTSGDDLFVSVAGITPYAGEIYLNRWSSAGQAWSGWKDAGGQAA